jgi:hypothetical protein
MQCSIYGKFFHFIQAFGYYLLPTLSSRTKKPTPWRGFSQALGLSIWQVRKGSAALDSSTETLVEALYTATGGRLFLLTGVERVAVGAHVQGKILTRRGAHLEAGTAGTVGGDRVVIRMDTLFHLEPHQRYAAT